MPCGLAIDVRERPSRVHNIVDAALTIIAELKDTYAKLAAYQKAWVEHTSLPLPDSHDTTVPHVGCGQRAISLIVSEEVSDEKYYGRHYTHFDWPEGASGPTVGIGYDCGYCTPQQIRADWSGIVDTSTVATLALASGIKGNAAQAWVERHRGDVAIDYATALRQFSEREIPKWERIVRANLPNCDLLTPDAFGALVSLTYNRGASFNSPGARYAEMRAIKLHMQTKDFGKIPDELMSMRRLWPQSSGLHGRRFREAALFRDAMAVKP